MISIIIPVYNRGMTISKCIDSILDQSFDDYEIVIIDDGSVDESLLICQKYQNAFPEKIKVYHFENHGVSWARNKGLNYIHGEYTVFIDSDDYVEKDYLKILFSHTKKCDLVLCGIKAVDESGTFRRTFRINPGEYDLQQYFAFLDKGKMNPFFGGTYNKLYKTKVLRENKILFIDNQRVAEDFYFNLQVLNNVKKIYVADENLYNYVLSSNNSLSSKNYSELDIQIFCNQLLNVASLYRNIISGKSLIVDNQILFQIWKMLLSKVNQSSTISISQKYRLLRAVLINKSYNSMLDAVNFTSGFENVIVKMSRSRIGLFIICFLLSEKYKCKRQ